MPGKLSVIGIGPGDPELLTLKAVRMIKEIQVLCVPKGREEGSSLALSIVEKAVSLEGKDIIEAYFPMKKTKISSKVSKRQSTADKKTVGAYCNMPLSVDSELDMKWAETSSSVLAKLREGNDVAFLTLGDPTIYSTFFYLYDMLLERCPGLQIEIVPGVSSINASAARAGMSLGLGNQKIAVLPANYMEDLKVTLEMFDTVVLMKVNKVFNDIVRLLSEMNLVENAVCISRAGMDDEIIFTDIRVIHQDTLNYFSMIIVRK